MLPTDARNRVRDILFSYASGRDFIMNKEESSFVHYTSAEVAFKIIQNQEIWMRNAIVMNDFSEIQYGEDCLTYSWPTCAKDRLFDRLNSVFPEMLQDISSRQSQTQSLIRYNTYLTCVSEHYRSEDNTGRLSMWRAYGGDNSVALVVNRATLSSSVDDLKAYSSPVSYFTREAFACQLRKVITNLQRDPILLKECGYDFIRDSVLRALRFSTLSTKHPGFIEEQEWRIIYTPDLDASEYIVKSAEISGGVPQTVYKLPIRDLSRIERVIVGPTKFPRTIRDAFVDLLHAKKVPNASLKVVTSDIPLRR